MHTQHDRYDAPSRNAPYTGRETEPRGIRAYSAEPHTHPDGYPRFGTGHFWLEVFTEMFKTMDLPIISGHAALGRPDAGWLTMAQLRRELLRPTTDIQIRDRAWRHVLTLVRTSGFGWHYFALGLATPGLWNRALTIAPVKKKLPPPHIARVHRTLATEFVLQMHNLADIDRPYIMSRLLENAAYATERHHHRKPPPYKMINADHETLTLAADLINPPDGTSHLGKSKQDAERFSVGEAYMALHRLWKRTNNKKYQGHDRISKDDAALIAYTYLEGFTLGQVAPWLGLSESGAQARREKIKKTIQRLLDPEADPSPQQADGH